MGNKIIAAERLQRMKEYIAVQKYVTINELVETFTISSATVRRYLKQLEKDGEIQCVHGGAKLVAPNKLDSNVYENLYNIKIKQNAEEKKRIAKVAADLVLPGNGVFLDSSSTVFDLGEYLVHKENISFCTNDVLIAAFLNMHVDKTVMMIGGKLRCGYNTVFGYWAENMIKELRVDIAFIGVDAIDSFGNIMITSAEELCLKRAAMQGADRAYVLCDHTKINKTALVTVCNIQEIAGVITGREICDEIPDIEDYFKTEVILA